MINGIIFFFEIVNFPFIDGDVPVCSNVDDFNIRNLFLTAKLFKQG